MSITPGFTVAEIRALVHEYIQLPHGEKTPWMADQPFTYGLMKRWRIALFQGDLDRGLIPREGSPMTIHRNERTAMEKSRAGEHVAHAAEVAKLSARVRELEDTNTALGKAIGLLHAINDREPATPQPKTDETSAS